MKKPLKKTNNRCHKPGSGRDSMGVHGKGEGKEDENEPYEENFEEEQ